MMNFILSFFAAALMLAGGEAPLSMKMIESQIHRSEDDPSYLDYRNGKARWSYTPGLELRAFFDAYERYGGEEVFRFAEKWYDGLVGEDGTIKTYKLENYNVDHVCPGKSLLYLYDKTGKEKYLKAAHTLMEQLKTHPKTTEGALWHKLVYPHQVWLDGVYMAEPFYVEYACRFYKGEELREALDAVVNEFEVAYRHTLDPATGLLRHAWDESRSQRWCDPRTGQSAHCWARALGWYLMAAVDVLDYMPESHPGREVLLSKLRAQLSGLPKWADPSTGMWYQVLDCPGREGNYLEATSCAMFTYVFLKSARLGYIDPEKKSYARGLYDSLVKTFISTDAQGFISLEKCCSVGGLGGKNYRMGDYAYYLSEPVRPNDSKGVGPFVWASMEVEMLSPDLAEKGRTAFSLFLKNDRRQVSEIGADGPVPYKLVGHHGPAVENSHMAIRIYYNDSGAIDLYSKSGHFMELEKYLWYPSAVQQSRDGAGCDEYLAGKTVGFGGIALWDGAKEVRPAATSGRLARVGKTRKGAFCEVVEKGVVLDGKTLDISIRVDVFNDSRYARVTATSLTGEKVRFVTGINYHPGEELHSGKDWIAVWGVHPADVSKHPCQIGAGMRFKASDFTPVEKTDNTLRIVSRKPVRKISTLILASSVKDDTLPDIGSFLKELSR